MIYVKKAGTVRPYIVDETLPEIQDQFRRGELLTVPTVAPSDAQRGVVTPEQIRNGDVVVTDGEELKPPIVRMPMNAAEIGEYTRANAERGREYSASKERVNDRRQEDVDMSTVGPGAGKAMTVDQFLTSGAHGYIRKSELTGYHSVDLRLISSGRVRVIED